MAMYIVICFMRRVFSYFLKNTIAMHSSVENESTEQYTIHIIQVSVKRMPKPSATQEKSRNYNV